MAVKTLRRRAANEVEHVSEPWHPRSVQLDSYRRVLGVRSAREVLLLGLLIRIPIFANSIVLTLHVVTSLHRDYGSAGVVSAVATICVAISGPWRGRLLDRLGLRRVVLPSIVVNAVCWSIAPFTGYWLLFGLAGLAGLFLIPTFSVIRQAVIAAVPDSDRRTALALDSVAVEVSFMIGPVVGVWAATVWSTSWVLFVLELGEAAAGVALWIANPALRSERDARSAAAAEPPHRLFSAGLLSANFVAVCLTAFAALVVLGGTDIAIVAALRHFHSSSLIGPVLAVWGLGSLVGGLIYGAWHRPIPAYLLLGGLSLVTLPVAFTRSEGPLILLVLVAGVLCAPTITATVDQVSQVVPAAARGEAMGWHGSAMTAGSALGAPLAGVAIDRSGYPAGFIVVSSVGLAVGLVAAYVAMTQRSDRHSGQNAASSRAGNPIVGPGC
jgi:predicted MFS family arabinose efflux permease